MNERIAALCGFLDASHSQYHARAYLASALDAAGYTRLDEAEEWRLLPGGKYYVNRGGSALLAFRIPEGSPKGFLISAAHTDRPTFKVKENGELDGQYARLAVERYGGQILSPWLDRPLSIAGRVLVKTEKGAQVKLLDIDRDLLLIPNVAIHMNRSVNEGYKWNPVTDVIPLLGGPESKGKFQALLEAEAGGPLLSHDLFLYIRQKATVWGIDESFVSSAALDDLECVWGCFQGFLKSGGSRCIPLFCALDSEEVGSCSPQGAGSTVLRDTISRICAELGLSTRQMLARSFLVSADNAHGLHPNHPELADSGNAPMLGKGIVVKFNANLKYCTDGLSAGVFRAVCERAKVPTQNYCNRPDIPGGSTLGCISIGQVSVPTVDIGLPQLAMHSCYETAAVADALFLEDAMQTYFSSTLELSENGFSLC